MDKKVVADILDQIGTLLELKGENPFKCRAYHNAARVVSALTEDIVVLLDSGRLKEVKGIGEKITEKIEALVRTGKLRYYEELKASLPGGLVEMLRIQGLGPKRVKTLYDKLGIKSIPELKKAVEGHKLRDLEGFGEKTEENILKGIQLLAISSTKHLYSTARESADRILLELKKLKQVERCEVAGSLRRKKELIGDIDIVVSAKEKDRKSIMDVFVSLPNVTAIQARGDTKSSVVLDSGINCDVRIVSDESYPFALNYFTGSKEHNIRMRSRANDFGWSLNEYAFTPTDEKNKRKKVPICRNEEDIYQSLKLSYVPAELREDRGEIEAAEEGKIPTLVDDNDMRGTFHCHTTYSDGMNTLEEMVTAARKLGWEYIGIADHSKAAAYAGGLTEEQVKEQMKAIDKLNSTLKGFRIFKGTEADIFPDGSLDYSEKLLSQFDYVVASIHNKFKMTAEEATKRIITALKNKYVTMLGHPTGRLLLAREGYSLDVLKVIDAAADYGKSIEINAHPQRLDLDWTVVKYAKEKGVMICINPDAHNADGLLDMKYGVGIARKGWLEAKNVLNTYKIKEVEQFFNK